MSRQNAGIPALLVAGGRPRDPEAMARMMSRAFEGIEKARVAYIGTANNDNPAFFLMMKSTLIKAGADKVTFLHLAKKKPDLNLAKDAMHSSDLIFLAGGEVEDGMKWLEEHGLSAFLKELYAQDKRFMGVSAGVIMMGTHWVRWKVPEKDDTSELFDCLGIIPLLFDVHGEDEDWIELKAALKLIGDCALGYGLPGGSMISADDQGRLVNLEKEYMIFANENGQIRIR